MTSIVQQVGVKFYMFNIVEQEMYNTGSLLFFWPLKVQSLFCENPTVDHLLR